MLPVSEIVSGMLFPSDVDQICLIFLQIGATPYWVHLDDETVNDEEI